MSSEVLRRAIEADQPARLAVVDDDARVLDALVFQLRTAGFSVSSHLSAENLLEAPDFAHSDCVVADICLPKLNGLQLLSQIKQDAPFMSVIFITGHGDMAMGVEAMREGAIDCFEKPVDDAALLRAVERDIKITREKRTEFLRKHELQSRHEVLTHREREVFALIAAGLLNKQVGAELGPSEGTVKKHRARIMRKMGADSLADLVRMAEIIGADSSRKNEIR
jgi:FixJ family two-component response regulator